MKFEAYVSTIRGNRAGDLSEKIVISASYEQANILGEITFEVPIKEADQYWVGKKIFVCIEHY